MLKGFLAFLFIFATRVLASMLLPILDCDETYNYWEPLHFMLFGRGLQTWEYSAQFALRSWAFVGLYGVPARVMMWLWPGAVASNKAILFFVVKFCVAFVNTCAEWYFIQGARQRFGTRASVILGLLITFAAGHANAATAFLPSSFAMTCYFVAGGAWLRHHHASPSQKRATRFIMIAATLAAALLGWPFAGLVGVPIGLYVLFRKPLKGAVLDVVIVTAAIVGSMVAVDSQYYCRPVFASWSIVAYNIFGGEERGPHLYGVEPWHYFFRNLLLNFNVTFVIALVAPALCFSVARLRERVLFMTPFVLWFTFWLRVPHKEERFMVPAYPFLTLSAALAIDAVFPTQRYERVAPVAATSTPGADKRGRRTTRRFKTTIVLVTLLLTATAIVSLLRLIALHKYYHGHEELAVQFASNVSHRLRIAANRKDPDLIPLCVGREWHRFPSSFFVPIPYNVTPGNFTRTVGFFRTSTFGGALPLPFLTDDRESATCAPRLEMNDLNKEIAGQYVEKADIARRCMYIIDTEVTHDEYKAALRSGSSDATPFGDDFRSLLFTENGKKTFAKVAFSKVMDIDATPARCRAIVVPIYDRHCAKWKNINLYYNTAIHPETD